MRSSKSRACKSDFDYLYYHTHGVKMAKDRTSAENDAPIYSVENLESIKMQELHIFNDIQEIYDTNLVDEVETVDELTEVLDECTTLSKHYRHAHVELKYLLGTQYAPAYPYYDQRLAALRKYISSIKTKIRGLRETAVSSDHERLTSSLKTEEELLSARLQEFLVVDFDENSKISEVQENVFQLKQFLETYYNLLSKAKVGLRTDFEDQFGTLFDDTIFKMKDKIKNGTDLVEKIQSNLEAAAVDMKKKEEEEISKKFISDQKFQANAILSEIKNRCDSVVKKCSVSLSDLSDFQLFELQKDLRLVDIEMRELFGSVTAYSKIASTCGVEKDALLKKAEDEKKKALDSRNTYAM